MSGFVIYHEERKRCQGLLFIMQKGRDVRVRYLSGRKGEMSGFVIYHDERKRCPGFLFIMKKGRDVRVCYLS